MAVSVELGYRWTAEGVAIDAVATCERHRGDYPDVALVVDPHNRNPGVEVRRRVLAVDLLRRIIDFVEARPWEADAAAGG